VDYFKIYERGFNSTLKIDSIEIKTIPSVIQFLKEEYNSEKVGKSLLGLRIEQFKRIEYLIR